MTNRNWKMWISQIDDLPRTLNPTDCDEFVDWCETNYKNGTFCIGKYEIVVPEWVPESQVEKFAERYLYADAFGDSWDASSTIHFIVEN